VRARARARGGGGGGGARRLLRCDAITHDDLYRL
jgi:hypothetical protein